MTATCLCPALPSCAALAKKIYMWSHCGGKSRCQVAFLLVFSEANKIIRPVNALVATVWVCFIVPRLVAGCCVESVRILRSARFLLPFFFGGRVGRGARTCHLLRARTCHVCLPSNRPFLECLRWLCATSSGRGNLGGCRCQVWKHPESFSRNVKWLQVNISIVIIVWQPNSVICVQECLTFMEGMSKSSSEYNANFFMNIGPTFVCFAW